MNHLLHKVGKDPSNLINEYLGDNEYIRYIIYINNRGVNVLDPLLCGENLSSTSWHYRRLVEYLDNIDSYCLEYRHANLDNYQSIGVSCVYGKYKYYLCGNDIYNATKKYYVKIHKERGYGNHYTPHTDIVNYAKKHKPKRYSIKKLSNRYVSIHKNKIIVNYIGNNSNNEWYVKPRHAIYN